MIIYNKVGYPDGNFYEISEKDCCDSSGNGLLKIRDDFHHYYGICKTCNTIRYYKEALKVLNFDTLYSLEKALNTKDVDLDLEDVYVWNDYNLDVFYEGLRGCLEFTMTNPSKEEIEEKLDEIYNLKFIQYNSPHDIIYSKMYKLNAFEAYLRLYLYKENCNGL